MIEPLISSAAHRDMPSILEYVARDNVPAAIRLIADIQERWYLLAQHPLLGSLRPEWAEHLRVFVCRGYGIYYKPHNDTIWVARVLHPRLNLTPDMFKIQ